MQLAELEDDILALTKPGHHRPVGRDTGAVIDNDAGQGDFPIAGIEHDTLFAAVGGAPARRGEIAQDRLSRAGAQDRIPLFHSSCKIDLSGHGRGDGAGRARSIAEAAAVRPRAAAADRARANIAPARMAELGAEILRQRSEVDSLLHVGNLLFGNPSLALVESV